MRNKVNTYWVTVMYQALCLMLYIYHLANFLFKYGKQYGLLSYNLQSVKCINFKCETWWILLMNPHGKYCPWIVSLNIFTLEFGEIQNLSSYFHNNPRSSKQIQIQIEFIGVTLVWEIIQVSSVQLNKTSSAHCSMLQLPQAKTLFIPILTLCPPSV